MIKMKRFDNKGFSLVEMLVVIAITAVFMGVMAPQFIHYLERAKESSDQQFAGTVKTAVTLAFMDPNVIDAQKPGLPKWNTVYNIAELNANADTKDGEFAKNVAEILGVAIEDMNADWVQEKLKSKNAAQVWFQITDSHTVEVYITKGNPAVPDNIIHEIK